MKTITINNVDQKINYNALTYLYYRQIFDKSIFDDINIIREFLLLQIKANSIDKEEKDEINKNILLKLNSYIDAISRLTYTAIYTQNQNIEDYTVWIKKNEILEQNNDCIAIVIDNVVNCFIDEKVSEELEKINKSSGDDTEVLFPEHYFLSACLRAGLTIKDLETLSYIDVLKIFLSYTKKEKRPRKATQADWDRLAGRR